VETGVPARLPGGGGPVTSTRRTEVDGVPVLVAKTTGPMRAGLVFRVGRADERLPTAGITHLVEHLALHRHGVTDYHYDGTTGLTTTSFLIQGASDAVVAFLHGVCANLRDLPTARLDTEKRIIETEAAGRAMSVAEQMAVWRHGARDFGLPAFPEFGIRTLTADQVTDWVATRFTRGNAALWVAGDDVPAGLRLDLPDGGRRDLPAESSALPVTPAYFTAGATAVVVDARVPRGAAATVYARLLERALFRDLRQERGLSYTAATDYHTDGRRLATVTALADAHPDDVERVLEAFLGQLRALRDAEVDVGELEAARGMVLARLTAADIEADRLPRRAVDLLTGFPDRTTDALVAELEELTADGVRDIARAADRSALLMLPDSVRRPPAGYEAAPTSSRFSVTGKRYRSRADPRVVLVHGSDGLTLDTPDGPLTVLYDECAALLRRPDGARHLVGADAIGVRVEPSLFPVPAGVLAAVDAAVGTDAIVDLPPRDPGSMPKPARARAFRTRLRTLVLPLRARWGHLFSRGYLLWAAFVVAMFAGPVIAFYFAVTEGRRVVLVLSVIGLIAAFRLVRGR
jgi:predicted Zn-dependent peptidase